MSEIFKTYRVKIVILSPTHIGCGEDYSPQDFYVKKLHSQQDNKDYYFGVNFPAHSMIHDPRFTGEVKERFTELAMKKDVEVVRDLLRYHAVHKWKGRDILLSQSFVEHYTKVMGYTPEEFRKQMQDFQIMRTAYNPHTGEPFIPGSGLKGALRTAILAKLAESIQTRLDLSGVKGTGRRQDADKNTLLQTEALRVSDGKKMTKEDPLFNLSVSDFKLKHKNPNQPRPATKIQHVLRVKKNPPVSGILPIINEMIIPYQYFEGSISIRSIRSSKVSITKDLLIDSCTDYYKNLLSVESNRLGKLGIDPKASTNFKEYIKEVQGDKNPRDGNYFLIRLGRYKGAESQTIPGYREILVRAKTGNRVSDSATTMSLAVSWDRHSIMDGVAPGWAVVEFEG